MSECLRGTVAGLLSASANGRHPQRELEGSRCPTASRRRSRSRPLVRPGQRLSSLGRREKVPGLLPQSGGLGPAVHRRRLRDGEPERDGVLGGPAAGRSRPRSARSASRPRAGLLCPRRRTAREGPGRGMGLSDGLGRGAQVPRRASAARGRDVGEGQGPSVESGRRTLPGGVRVASAVDKTNGDGEGLSVPRRLDRRRRDDLVGPARTGPRPGRPGRAVPPTRVARRSKRPRPAARRPRRCFLRRRARSAIVPTCRPPGPRRRDRRGIRPCPTPGGPGR